MIDGEFANDLAIALHYEIDTLFVAHLQIAQKADGQLFQKGPLFSATYRSSPSFISS